MADSNFEMNWSAHQKGADRTFEWHCPPGEERLMEYADGTLSLEESKGVEAHLAVCPECREIALAWQRLDTELEAKLVRSSLTPGFRDRVLQAIDNDQEKAAAGMLGYCQPEWRGHSRHFFRNRFPSLLDNIGYGMIAVLAGCLLFKCSGPLLSIWAQFISGSYQKWAWPLGLVLAFFSLLTAFGASAGRPIKRWLRSW